MTIPFKSIIGAVAVAGATSLMASAVMAETPADVLMFSGFGNPELDELPLELSDDSDGAPAIPPLEVTDLGVTPEIAAVETPQTSRVLIENTWAIGVFR